jgi:hypothetical protein
MPSLKRILGGWILWTLVGLLAAPVGWAARVAPKKPLPAKVLVSGHIEPIASCSGNEAPCALVHMHVRNDLEFAVSAFTGTYELTGGSAQGGGLAEPRSGALVVASGGAMAPGTWAFAAFPAWTPPSSDIQVEARLTLELTGVDGRLWQARATCFFSQARCDRSNVCTLLEEEPPAPPPRRR